LRLWNAARKAPAHDFVRGFLVPAHHVHLDLSRVLGGGVDHQRSILEDEAYWAGVEGFHVSDGGITHLVNAAPQQVLVMKNEAVRGEVDHVVAVIQPRFPQKDDGEQEECDSERQRDGVHLER
jgi:hypothetical protein